MCDEKDDIVQRTNAYYFIDNTDKKNLKTQIKQLVGIAIEVKAEDLSRRRKMLKTLLETEATQYENEFTNKVLTRIDNGIKDRRSKLLTIVEERKKSENEHKRMKVMQTQMNRSYEVREALARRMNLENRRCLEEQIIENQRRQVREQKLADYWHRVDQTNCRRIDEAQKYENFLKCKTQERMNLENKFQQDEHKAEIERMRAETMEDGKKIDALRRQLELEEFDKKHENKAEKGRKYVEDLLEMIEEKRAIKREERKQAADEHRKMIAELQRLQAADNEAIHKRRRDLHNAFVEFIGHQKRMRGLEEKRLNAEAQCHDDLKRMDDCKAKSKVVSDEQKAARLKKYYAELKDQVCEQYERVLREDAERHEPGMTYNPFDRPDTPRGVVLERRRKYRRQLDEQLAALREIRAAEDAWFAARLPKAADDPEALAELRYNCEFNNDDYLPPHPLWRPLACDRVKYKNKPYTENTPSPCNAAVSGITHTGQPVVPNWCTEMCDKVAVRGGTLCPPWFKRCHL